MSSMMFGKYEPRECRLALTAFNSIRTSHCNRHFKVQLAKRCRHQGSFLALLQELGAVMYQLCGRRVTVPSRILLKTLIIIIKFRTRANVRDWIEFFEAQIHCKVVQEKHSCTLLGKWGTKEEIVFHIWFIYGSARPLWESTVSYLTVTMIKRFQ